jgi:hypothetical protein
MSEYMNSINKKQIEREVVLTIARMNPPTSGHIEIIKQMMIYALKNRVPSINIILSPSSNDPKNPLPCYVKKQIIDGTYCLDNDGDLETNSSNSSILNTIKDILIEDNFDEKDVRSMKVNIICGDDPTVLKYTNNPMTNSLIHLLDKYDHDYIRKISVFIGEDRKGSYGWVARMIKPSDTSVLVKTSSRKSNKTSSNRSNKSSRSISKNSGKRQKLQQTVEYNEVVFDRDEDAISATRIRGYVQKGDWESFYESYRETGLTERCIRKLYDELDSLLSKTTTVKATSRVTKKTKGKTTVLGGGVGKPKEKSYFDLSDLLVFFGF